VKPWIGIFTLAIFLMVGPTKPSEAMAAPRSEHSEEVTRLLTAAKDKGERELDLTWSETSLGGHAGAKKFEALFNRMYGANIRVNFTPGPSMTEMAGKVTQEVAAGRKASTDILLGSESHYASLLDRGVLEEYDYTRLSARIKKELVAHKNMGVEIYSTISAINYHTGLVPSAEAPKRLEDVFKPEWKGKIASTINAAYFDRVAYRPEWGPEKMKAFLKRLSEHVGGLVRATESERIISGEFIMLVMSTSHDVRRQKAMGAPLGTVIPEDGATVGVLHLGVPRNSAHPSLAKLFINMIVSEEGQKVLFEVYHADHHELPGSRSAADLRELSSKGIRPLKVNVKFVADHPELRGLADEFRKILREKR
jgi:ABC-type Fe3+ transport system substrate-binding protein